MLWLALIWQYITLRTGKPWPTWDLRKLWARIWEGLTFTSCPCLQDRSYQYAQFGHLLQVSGYDAGCYSYIWYEKYSNHVYRHYTFLLLLLCMQNLGLLTSGHTSAQVFAAELFQTLFALDPRDQAAWERYRRGVLEYDGSRDELRLLEEFLGHRSTSAVLFHGLKPTPGS